MQKLLKTVIQTALAASIFVAPIAITPLYAQASLPQLGDGEDMSVVAERKLGNRIAREIYRDPDYLDDPLVSDYVQRIWQPLLKAARQRGEITPEQDARFAWEVMLARDRTVNAFALPGGYLGVHLGLIALVGNRDELASVLAHELSHVTQRHIARITSKQSQQAPWLLGALILGTLAARKNSDAAGAVITGSQAASAQAQLNFSRDMEREADRIGYQVMQDAGFAVQGFVGMFDKLALANRINDNGSFPYLRTHPLTSERIGDMQARMQLGAPAALLEAQQALAIEHAIISNRARLLANPSTEVLRAELQRARTAINAPATTSTSNAVSTNASAAIIKRIAELTSGAWAALRLREPDTALQLAKLAGETLKNNQNQAVMPVDYAQTAIDLIASEAALAQLDPARAIALLERAMQAPSMGDATSNPSGHTMPRPVLLQFARAATALGVASGATSGARSEANAQALVQASDKLQSWLADHPRDALAWDALADVFSAQGLSLRALRAQAESRVAVLDYSAALDRFKAAQALALTPGRNSSIDHVEASIIDARARAVLTQLKEFESEKPN